MRVDQLRTCLHRSLTLKTSSQLRLPILAHPLLDLPPPPRLPLILGPEPTPVLLLLPRVVLQQVQTLLVHLHLQEPVHARLPPPREGPLGHQAQDLVPAPRDVDDARGGGLDAAEPPGLEDHGAVDAGVGHLDAEDGAHGGLERGAELELVEAGEAARRVHDAVVVVHGEHEPARERVPAHPRHRRHRVREQPPVERPEAAGPVGVALAGGVVQVQPVGVELGQRRGRHDHARGEPGELDEVEGAEERLAHGRGQAVVGRGVHGQEVDLGMRLGDGHGSAWMGITCRDGDGEERVGTWDGHDLYIYTDIEWKVW